MVADNDAKARPVRRSTKIASCANHAVAGHGRSLNDYCSRPLPLQRVNFTRLSADTLRSYKKHYRLVSARSSILSLLSRAVHWQPPGHRVTALVVTYFAERANPHEGAARGVRRQAFFPSGKQDDRSDGHVITQRSGAGLCAISRHESTFCAHKDGSSVGC